ncbi:MAG: hypothetical protein WHV61_00335 [Burkholderiales bacterium]
MTRRLMAILWLALLAACATPPRHQTVKEYVAPPGAQACVDDCARRRDTCEADCAQRYQACRDALLPEVRARYAQRLEAYQNALAAYRWELERYRMELMLGWGYWPPYWGWWGGVPPFPPPPPPAAPTLEQELERLSRERCDHDCGCETAYDACFKACGGSIRHETRCVAGCGGKP